YGSAVFFKCINDRNTNNLVPQMKTAINQAPWATKSLPKIKYLKSNNYLVKGFNEVKKFENAAKSKDKIAAQYENLLQTAYHEQKMILQPLIYEDKRHQIEIDAMGLAGPFAPAVQLYFSNACKVPQDGTRTSEGTLGVNVGQQVRIIRGKAQSTASQDKYISKPDTDIVLYNYDSRMKWIKDAAQKFHQLMQDEKVYMHSELTTMAGWYNKADS
ncbi:DUF2515 family protein, partial [Psychrobacter sp. AOP22-C1-22]|uniref:DUF2515 family protein n=1 Tax=unclassified Psychrobacter TaxID=196806 RepID=UPI0040381A52